MFYVKEPINDAMEITIEINDENGVPAAARSVARKSA